ncbi:MAG: serine hydrolase domain-containing protein [Terracidiphilus sp.]|jgi:CubicO group peptidase (beta-lactamase class C family)
MKRIWRTHLLAVLFALAAINVIAQGLPTARPEDEGFSSERLAYIDQFYSEKIAHGDMAGIVTLVSRHGKIVHFSALGYADVEKHTKMQKDTIFRQYSMTKAIASTALMTLYEQGRFQIDDPISKFLPEFANLRVLRNPDGPLDETVALDRPPSIHDIMRHTAGFTHGLSPDKFDDQYEKANLFSVDMTLDEMMKGLAKIPLRYQPGTKWAYSVGPDVQARLVEVLSGEPFDVYLQKHIFDPLGMKDTGFWLGPDKADRLATVHWMKDGKLVPIDEAHGHPGGDIALFQPWSVNSYTVNHKRKGGSYGLVATAQDYWRFAQMILNGGELNGVRILSPQTVHFMGQDHLAPAGIPDYEKGSGFGLGFAVIENQAAAATLGSDGGLFWGGAAATSFWIDPKEDIVVIAMTQHMGAPAAEEAAGKIRTLVYSALIDNSNKH